MYEYKNTEYSKNHRMEDDELELDFWSDTSDILSDATSSEINIDNFENYVRLIIMLMKEYNLEEVIKLIKNQNETE